MSSRTQILAERLAEHFPQLKALPAVPGDVALEVPQAQLLEVLRQLRDDPQFGFEQLIDLSGVDYLNYGREEWQTQNATNTGFSRGVNREGEQVEAKPASRFAVTYQLLSVSNNWRLRVRSFAAEGEPPIIDSVVDIWAGANWFEREAFDMFGILFRGHPDLRRILTDYGFIGHPFRKDFPLVGNVEVKYDQEKGRVVYQPVSIVPRTLVPRVIRADNRYEQQLKEVPVGAAQRR